MHRWLIVTILLYITIAWANGFLYTPQFQVFINTMRENDPNQQFAYAWDFSNNINNNNGFTYATNQYGKFFLLLFLSSCLQL